MLMTVTIELRVDFDGNKEKEQIMLETSKGLARHLLGTAALISDKRKPHVAVTCGDLFATTEEIEILDDPIAEA